MSTPDELIKLVEPSKVVLLITCIDGLISKPLELGGRTVHEIRIPGGVLSTILNPEVVDIFLGWITLAIEKKSPGEIILLSHSHCAAATELGLSDEKVADIHFHWYLRLQTCYPGIRVRILSEYHSPCGTKREPHQEQSLKLVA